MDDHLSNLNRGVKHDEPRLALMWFRSGRVGGETPADTVGATDSAEWLCPTRELEMEEG